MKNGAYVMSCDQMLANRILIVVKRWMLAQPISKAADAGDPRGWLALGFEYNMGKLGGDPPYWYQKAMEAYTKAAGGGNCLAMVAIADLYAKGNGVPVDTAQAQSWQAKAQSCQGGNIAIVQQQVAQYKARAAAARDPALDRVLAALPNIPNAPAQAAPGNSRSPAQTRSVDRSGFNQSIVTGLVVAAVAVIAAGLLIPNPPPGSDCCDTGNSQAMQGLANQGRCTRVSNSGLDPNLLDC